MSYTPAASYEELSESFMGEDSAFLDMEKLFDSLVASDLNPNALAIQTKDLKKCPNIIKFVRDDSYLKITPFARQAEILVNLFEDYCPHCSDMNVVNDMWGMALDDIFSKVQLLEFGRCPTCHRSKTEFRREGMLRDYQELVGVAGQRCLDPELEVLKMDGSMVKMKHLKAGDWLAPSDPTDRSPAIVKEVIGSVQPGVFKLYFDGLSEPVTCSDNHQWVIIGDSTSFIYNSPKLLQASELKVGDYIQSWDTPFRKLVRIDKVKMRMNLVDLEIVGHKTFCCKNGLVLHNSGKTAITAMIANYVLQQYLTIDGMPYEYFGLAATTVRGTFVATSKAQAGETLWQNFLDMYDSCRWMKEYVEVLQEVEYDTGDIMYRRLGESLHFRNKALALTFEAASPARLRGKTRFMGGMDELGWFQSGEEYVNSGQECYASIANSLRTVRSASNRLMERGEADPLRGWMFNISSPQSEDDPIMPLLENAKIPETRTYGFHYATWEINPTITKEDLKSEMLKDPTKFWRDFGACPPTASGAFLTQPESVNALCGDHDNAVEFSFKTFTRNVGTSVYHYITPQILGCYPHNVSYPRVVAIDAGEVDNSYSISVGYHDFESGKNVLEMHIETEPRVSQEGQAISVSFESVSEIIRKQLKDQFNIVYFVADRWNSTSTLEQARDAGLEAWKYSPTYADFKLLRARIFNQECEIPKLDAEPTNKHPPIESPIARLVLQAKTVRDGRNKLYKPVRGSDDGFRAWALLDIVLTNERDNLREVWEMQKRRGKKGKGSAFAQTARRLRYGSATTISGISSTSGTSYGGARRLRTPNKR
ncbi:hypothetical protein KFS98_003526 [Salmonella enterica]|nr:hypothetical protein [Salmonella enterica]